MRKSSDRFPSGSKRRLNLIKILEKVYGLKCWYCSYSFNNIEEIQIDHIIPLSQGGKTEKDNLALACDFCNNHKHDYTLEEFLNHLAYLRSSSFSCPILSHHSLSKLEPITHDILQKSFYQDNQ
jgi:5-methylcytosine-specific restriction endonuclease McrA